MGRTETVQLQETVKLEVLVDVTVTRVEVPGCICMPAGGGGGGCEMLPSAAGFVMDPVTESNAPPPRYEELVSPMRFTSTGQMKLGQKV